MINPTRKRKKIFVQRSIQGGLVVRTVLYWFFCLCTIFLFVAMGTLLSGDLKSSGELFAGIWRQYSAAVLASVFMIPLVALDVVRFSHRVVGPLIRLEAEMKRLADGQSVDPLRFRKNDHWHGLAEQFNRIAREYQRSSQPPKRADEWHDAEMEAAAR